MSPSRWTATSLLPLLAAAVVVLGLNAASAQGTTPLLSGANGSTPVLLFDKDDIRIELASDWNLEFMTICNPATARQYRHNLAVVQDPTDASVQRVYVPILAFDDEIAPTEAHVGIVEAVIDDGALSSMRTVLRETWVYDTSDAGYISEWTAVVVAPDDIGTLIDAGNLLLVRKERTSSTGFRNRLYALDATATSPALIDVYQTGEQANPPGTPMFTAMPDGSGDLIFGAARLSWNGTAYGVANTFFANSYWYYSGFTAGSDGYLYGALNVDTKGKTVHKVDPTGLDSYVSYATLKSNRFLPLCLDGADKLWALDYNKRKSPPYYLTKRNGKAKFPYGKRVAVHGNATGEGVMRSLTLGGDGELYCAMFERSTTDWNVDEDDEVSIWRIER